MTSPQKCLSGTGTGKDKSSFAMTCNRLSLLMKEKGSTSLRDIGINATFDVKETPEISTNVNMTLMTVDLLSNMRSAVQTTEKTEKSVNELPRFVSFDSFCKADDSRPDKSVSGEMVTTTGCKTSQMTILYNGQILVFDHVSADKARDMMLVANDSSSSSPSDDDDDNQIQNRIPLASTSNSVCEIFGLREENESDLPIARRSSLQKFLSKRKERARSVRRGPYRLNHRVMADPSFNRNNFDLNF